MHETAVFIFAVGVLGELVISSCVLRGKLAARSLFEVAADRKLTIADRRRFSKFPKAPFSKPVQDLMALPPV